MAVRVQETASFRIDDIWRFTRDRRGADQADRYIAGLFAAFDRIAPGDAVSRPIPADFGVDGFYTRYERHVIYWRPLANGDVGIVTVLHERMHRMERFRQEGGGCA